MSKLIKPEDYLKDDKAEQALQQQVQQQKCSQTDLKQKKEKNRGIFYDKDNKPFFEPLIFACYFLLRVTMFCVGSTYYAYNRTEHCYQEINIRTIKKLVHLILDELSPSMYSLYRGEQANKAIFETVKELDSLTATPSVIVFLNGTLYLNLNNGKPMHFTKRFSSKNIVFQTMPYNYNPQADCPRFKQFVREIMCGNKALKHLLLDCLSNIFCFGEVNIHQICYFYGIGRNGKSVLLELLGNHIFPEMCSHVHIDKLCERFATSSLVDKVANFSPESEVSLSNTDVLKEISSGATTTAEFKYKDSFSVRITAKLFVATNKLPYTEDFSKGWSDRLTIIPFEQVFEVPPADGVLQKGVLYQNPNLLHELAEETEGIAALLLRNLDNLKKKNWVLARSKKAESYKQMILLESQPVLLFFKSCIDIHPPEKRQRVRTSLLHKSFEQWCGKNNVEMHRFHSKTAFHKELRRVLHINGCDAKPREIKGYQYYLDISLKSNYLNNVRYQ